MSTEPEAAKTPSTETPKNENSREPGYKPYPQDPNYGRYWNGTSWENSFATRTGAEAEWTPTQVLPFGLSGKNISKELLLSIVGAVMVATGGLYFLQDSWESLSRGSLTAIFAAITVLLTGATALVRIKFKDQAVIGQLVGIGAATGLGLTVGLVTPSSIVNSGWIIGSGMTLGTAASLIGSVALVLVFRGIPAMLALWVSGLALAVAFGVQESHIYAFLMAASAVGVALAAFSLIRQFFPARDFVEFLVVSAFPGIVGLGALASHPPMFSKSWLSIVVLFAVTAGYGGLLLLRKAKRAGVLGVSVGAAGVVGAAVSFDLELLFNNIPLLLVVVGSGVLIAGVVVLAARRKG